MESVNCSHDVRTFPCKSGMDERILGRSAGATTRALAPSANSEKRKGRDCHVRATIVNVFHTDVGFFGAIVPSQHHIDVPGVLHLLVRNLEKDYDFEVFSKPFHCLPRMDAGGAGPSDCDF